MRILDAALAFVICLAGFATIITVAVEIFHRISGLRSRSLREVLETICVEKIIPEAKDKANKEAHKKAHEWVAAITRTPLKESNPFRWYPDVLSNATELTLQDFLNRLERDETFNSLLKNADNAKKLLFDEVEKKFEEYGMVMSNYFRRRAQAISLCAGIALAVVGNIDGVRLFERFLNDPALSARVEAQAKQLEGVINGAKNTAPAQEANNKELEAATDVATKLVASYTDMRLPIGWEYYPMCLAPINNGKSVSDPRCLESVAVKSSAKAGSFIADLRANITAMINLGGLSDLIAWLLRVVMTGCLIGLGGPFWFDVAKRIASVRGGPQESKGPVVKKTGKPGDDKPPNTSNDKEVENQSAPIKSPFQGKV